MGRNTKRNKRIAASKAIEARFPKGSHKGDVLQQQRELKTIKRGRIRQGGRVNPK